jgi:hypothetical protein
MGTNGGIAGIIMERRNSNHLFISSPLKALTTATPVRMEPKPSAEQAKQTKHSHFSTNPALPEVNTKKRDIGTPSKPHE